MYRGAKRRTHLKIDAASGTSNFDLIDAPGAGKRIVVLSLHVSTSDDAQANQVDFKTNNTEIMRGMVGPSGTWFIREGDEPLKCGEDEIFRLKYWSDQTKDHVWNAVYQVETI